METKQVLILGATSDMAMATGREFASKGYDILLAARNHSRLEPYALDLINRYGVQVERVEFDGAKYAEHGKLANDLSDSCTVVICAFGYLVDQTVAEDNWAESNQIIEANYTGAVSILNHIASKWKQRGSGMIIGIGSVAGDRGRSSNYIYGSAKAAFATYLAGLRNSLFHQGIHVMTVKPGFVQSKMTSHLDLPAKLTSTTEQVGKAIFKGYKKSKNVIYIGWIWRWIMLIIKYVPEPIFKRLKM
jgi:short-subunit dehydrogenase